MKYSKHYEEAKQEFIEKAIELNMQHQSYPLSGDYSIDTAHLMKGGESSLLIMTSGLHGIEGYVGSALFQVFMDRCMASFSGDILLIHGINPKGMTEFRRVNANNVDLNRSFLTSFEDLNGKANPSYQQISAFLNPKGMKGYAQANWAFVKGLFKVLAIAKPAALREAILKGQYEDQQGIYYGGQGVQEESAVILDIMKEWFIKPYAAVTVIDLHTGYGPRYDMSIVNSMLETKSTESFKEKFDYDRVLGLNKEEFYEIEGDFIDALYRLHADLIPEKTFYGTTFEFGTLGEGLVSEIRSLKTMIFENTYHQGHLKKDCYQKLIKQMKALYLPNEKKWMAKCEQDFLKAIKGIVTLNN